MSLFGKDNHIVLWWLLLGTLCSNSTEVCQLPSPLQSSSWNYTDNSRELILAFGTSTMSGFKYRFRGEDIENYDCISNTNNVYVFKSQDTFSKRGVANHVYACMKMTMVSSNLFYFYLLADTDNSILPNPERLYIVNHGLSDAFPTCDYCQYTTSPPDDDFRILRRSGQSSEDLSGIMSLCLPCEATCAGTSDVECSYPDTVDHATFVITGNNTGDTITYSCSNCYEEAGENSTRVCEEDGSWSGSPLSCYEYFSPVSCGTPPVVSHTSNVNTGTGHSDTITYTCLSGYEKTSGNLVRTCQADKNWSGKPPVCSPVSCGSLGAVSHTTNVTTGIYYTATITYTCVSGFEHTSGTLIRTCQANRNWNGSQPVCKECKGVSYMVFGFLVALIIVAVGIIIGLVCFIRIRLKDSSKEYKDIKITMDQYRNLNEDQICSELSDTQQVTEILVERRTSYDAGAVS